MTGTYTYISSSHWKDALNALKQSPNEASEWNIIPCLEDEDRTSRILPIHTACARQPPVDVIVALLKAYPEGAGTPDNQGLYPLHYACSNLASTDVVQMLVQAYPAAVQLPDPSGMRPIHHLVYWGFSSPTVLELLLDYCDSQTLASKDADGNTLLDLAYGSDHEEHLDYIISMLKRKPCTSASNPNVLPSHTQDHGSLSSKSNPISPDSTDRIQSPVSVFQIDSILPKDTGTVDVENLRYQLKVMTKVCVRCKSENESLKSSNIALEQELVTCKQEFARENDHLKTRVRTLQNLLQKMGDLVK